VARVALAITLGDPRGVGPEIVATAVARSEASGPRLIVVGPSGTAADAVSVDRVEIGAWHAGEGEVVAGKLAAMAIRRATELALVGRVAGIVTAPIHKHALRAAGEPYPGHTEMLAELAGAPRVGMLMDAERTALGGALRVLLATTHIPLAEVPRRLTVELLVEQAMLLDRELRRLWGMPRPRLALGAVNPHASDGGLFGDEEARVLSPAVDRCSARGLDVVGPVSADTVFVRALRGEFDAVIAPYHDVGMAAFKTASFGLGVNVTLGLPFVRTSPDHGTALDIAGLGSADPSSMLEAIRLAAWLAARGAHRSTSSERPA
jgi:4-hydroxythreonine-4-phosphate dehydrogenase